MNRRIKNIISILLITLLSVNVIFSCAEKEAYAKKRDYIGATVSENEMTSDAISDNDLEEDLVLEEEAGSGEAESYNLHRHNYSNYASVPNSYLYFNGDSPVRVEFTGGKLNVETYDSSFGYVSSRLISPELPIFGGFYSGSNYNFVVYGQSNTGESNSLEVLRVVKYSKSWVRQGSISFYGINTYIPFDAGSSSFAEYGSTLFIRTCHEMFDDGDGLHHQACMTFAINTSNMTEISKYCDIMNVNYGYVSHSFNQFIRVDGADVLAVDHGDAHPRAVVLGKYNAGASTGRVDGAYSNVNLITIPGSIGANYTGANVGGFEFSSSNYITAIARVSYDNNTISGFVKNVELLVQPKGNFSSSSTSRKTMTSNAEGGGVNNGNPYLVKISDNSFLLLWESTNTSTGKIIGVNAQLIDGSGNKVGSTAQFNAVLSDCAPVYKGGKVIWYAAGREGGTKTVPVFYQIGISGTSLSITNRVSGVYITDKRTSINKGNSYTFKAQTQPEDGNTTVTWTSSNPSVATVDSTGKVTAVDVGTADITASAAGFSDTVTVTVPSVAVSYVYFSSAYSTIYLNGGPYQFRASYSPSNATGDCNTYWSSSDPGIFTIDNEGSVTPVSAGTATVTARIGGKTAERSVTVVNSGSGSGGSVTTRTINVNSINELQSEHPYQNNIDYTWIYTDPSARALNVKFSADTEVESGYDKIYIYSDNSLVGTYSGTNLQNVTVRISSNRVKIRLKTDFSENYYGFKVVSVTPVDPGSGDPGNGAGNNNGSGNNNGQNNNSIQQPNSAREAAVKDFVSRMYLYVLDRAPDESGLNDWSTKLLEGQADGATLARGFICSREFKSRGYDDPDYLLILYLTFFDRNPDQTGWQTWMRSLYNGMSREEVLAGFVNSAEFGNLCDEYGIARGTMESDGSNIYNAGVRDFVLRNYEKALGRKGETAGVEDWAHRINTGQMSALEVAQSFFHSDEFLNKHTSNEEFVEILYETFLGRASESAGKADWVDRLASGTSRDEVMRGFAYSMEFRNIMARYGL